MSSQKAFLKPYSLFSAVTIDADKTSPETMLFGVDHAYIHIDWNTSTAVGAITVEVLYDDSNTWDALDFNSLIAITGASGKHQIKLKEIPFGRIRIKYISTSGTGVLNAWIQGKGV